MTPEEKYATRFAMAVGVGLGAVLSAFVSMFSVLLAAVGLVILAVLLRAREEGWST